MELWGLCDGYGLATARRGHGIRGYGLRTSTSGRWREMQGDGGRLHLHQRDLEEASLVGRRLLRAAPLALLKARQKKKARMLSGRSKGGRPLGARCIVARLEREGARDAREVRGAGARVVRGGETHLVAGVEVPSQGLFFGTGCGRCQGSWRGRPRPGVGKAHQR